MWGGAEINQAARTSTNHKQPLSVEESVPHSKQPWGGGGGGAAVLWVPSFNSLDKNDPPAPRSF